jgi:hypothetical protein
MSDNKMNTIDTQKIAEVVNRMHLPIGLGDKENACSIAAINLALTGELTDKIPDCMSGVIGRWIISTQDAMPDAMRNSPEWKRLLPLAAGTGREHEKERIDLLLNHMWTVALPLIQPVADAHGFGDEWRAMLAEKSKSAAMAAAAEAAEAAEAEAAEAAAEAAVAAEAEAEAARAAAEAAAEAARAAVWAAAAWAAAEAAGWAAAEAAGWETLNPCQLLADLIAAGGKEHE